MKSFILSLSLLLSFSVGAKSLELFPLATYSATPTTSKYLEIEEAASISLQFDLKNTLTGTATFFVSDYSGKITSFTDIPKWYPLSSDTVALSGTASDSVVKTFTTFPYRFLKVSYAPATGTPTMVVDAIIK